MVVREIAPGISSVGAVDWDRRLFDALIPLPEGTSYNAYLVKGTEKTVLIDTVDPSKELELVTNLAKAGLEKIDYVVVNHTEQDHSGALPMILELFPDATVLASGKARDLLIALLEIPEERIHVVKEGETVALGGRTLQFFITPWVHWPDTILTYLREDKILFSCDFFGAHMATSDLFATDRCALYRSAKRYYAEIMMPFRSSIAGYLEKLKGIEIRMIAPSHGPVYQDPSFILEAYRDWVSPAVKNEVVIAYVSMHGSNGKMVGYLTDALMARGVTVKPFDLTKSDVGELAMALVDAATVVLGAPTVLFAAHPHIVFAAYLTNILKPKTRFVSVIGSFGWGGKCVDQLTGMLDHLKVEVIPPVYIKGAPTATTVKELEKLADEIVQRHKAVCTP
jgi:flavorubredoxin